jgi:hypothetical protein
MTSLFLRIQTNNETDDGFGEMSDDKENEEVDLRLEVKPKRKSKVCF